MSGSTPPVREPPPADWPHLALYQRVRDALAAMPSHFRPDVHIAGLSAPNLHTLNTPLGATIEEQATATLNAMRSVWDPDKQYSAYSFVRQPQTFPDVRLVLAPGVSVGDPIIMGIELKGWYVFAKEGVPTYRFSTTPTACALADLLVVVPWALSEVISGRPVMFAPFIESARYVALYRNYWWEHVRDAKGAKGIQKPGHAAPYPGKADKISDVPDHDGGGNFGRIARGRLMDAYIEGIKQLPLAGVSISQWLRFFQSVAETPTD